MVGLGLLFFRWGGCLRLYFVVMCHLFLFLQGLHMLLIIHFYQGCHGIFHGRLFCTFSGYAVKGIFYVFYVCAVGGKGCISVIDFGF